MPRRPLRLAVVALHPIQYQAGLWRTLAQHPRLDVHVIYLDRVGVDGSVDPTMKAPMQWDVPLLEGHSHEFLPNWSPFRFTTIVRRVNPSLLRALRDGRYDAAVVHGYLTLSNWLVLWVARRTGLRLVYRGEGSLRGGGHLGSGLASRAGRAVNAFFLRRCDLIAYSSEDNRAYQLSRGAPEERLFPMPCAVDNEALERFAKAARPPAAVREQLGIPADAPVLVNVGRFTANKRTADAIDALTRGALAGRRDVHLLLAGDGPLRERLEARAREAGVAERVHFLGFLGQQRMVEVVLAADLFVSCSSHGDPSPKAMAEALFLRRPVLCSDGVGTCRDYVVDGENGFVFPSGDVDALAARLAELLDDPARRAAMGERSHAAAQKSDFRAGVDGLVEALDGLLDPA